MASKPLTVADLNAAARPTSADVTRTGVFYAVAAYGLWGVFPVYFKLVKTVSPLEVLAHRIAWSFLLLLIVLAAARGLAPVRAILRSRRTLLTLCATTLLIAGNWFVFIWAVANGHVMQASLGYYINPLVNVLLGAMFLRERLRGWQLLSFALAAIGVAYLTYAGQQFPTIALFLACTFGFYGLLRKTVAADALLGLTVETTLLVPIAAGYLVYLFARGAADFGQQPGVTALLVAAGPVTAVPLLLFAAAARRLKLATMGFIQYLAPTGHFLVALVYGEKFSRVHLIAFAFIWVALAIYSVDAARRSRAVPAVTRVPPEME